MSTAATSAPLPYADLPARWGITVDRAADSLRLVVPPVPGIRQLPNGMKFGAAIVAAILLGWLVHFVLMRPPEVMPTVINLCIYGFVLLITTAQAWARLSRRIVIEITPAALLITHLARGGRVLWQQRWLRHQVGGAKYSTSSGKVVIRIIGIDLVELFISTNRALTEWVAHTIDDALREPPAADAKEPEVSHKARPRPLRSGWRRNLLLLAAAVIAAGGVALCFTAYALPLAIYVLLAAAAPVGIALGTQEREYYL